MKIYFEVKVRYEKTLDNGLVKNVTDTYIVDAVSFTECEARITEEMKQYISGEFNITAEKITNIIEIVHSEEDAADKYYKIKINSIAFDEKTGKEKKLPSIFLVQAASIEDAKKKFDEFMKSSMMDYEVVSVIEMPYMDVFEYNTETA